MGTHSATTSDESQLSVSSMKLISSRSSSADSTDTFENDYFNQHTPDSTHPSPNSVSSNVESSDSSRNLQPPAVQSMENPARNASPYRIPSSVFARTNAAPGEWSTASNESLFSIQMGNMSFTRDFAQYLGKSGELGMYKKSGELSMYKKSGELGTDMRLAERNKSRDLGVSGELPTSMRPTTTGEMMNLSNIPQSAYQACPDSHPGVRATEAAAAETMKEVIREKMNKIVVKLKYHLKITGLGPLPLLMMVEQV
ncbi:hypothetical protein QQ045_031053 [Rhodiola kirilowii]